MTTITYTATDPAGNTATATQSVTVVDRTSPVVAASLPPVGRVKRRVGKFRVGFSATDNCEGDPSVLAVMAIPPGAESFQIRSGTGDDDDDDGDDSGGDAKITFDYDRRLITLLGGDQAALRSRLARILADVGVAVQRAQQLRLDLRHQDGDGDDDSDRHSGGSRIRQRRAWQAHVLGSSSW